MKAGKYYFEDTESEICYTKEHFDAVMESDGVTEMRVHEAIPDKLKGIFWCACHAFCGDDSKKTCGKQCKQYAPRNGKNGCCKNYTTKIYAHGEMVTIKLTSTEIKSE